MIERVVVPVDMGVEAGRALPVAATLARRSGARLSVLVVGSEHGDMGYEQAAAYVYLDELGIEDAEIIIDQSAEPAAAIAGHAASPGTLVCMASHGRSPLAELFLGSVADDVLHQAAGPVVLVGPRVRPDFDPSSLLMCVDGTEHAQVLLPIARQLVVDLDLDPAVVRVVTKPTPSVMGSTRVAADLGMLNRPGPPVRVEELVDRHPTGAIVQLIASEPGPLLMVASAHTGRLARLVHGSMTARVVRRATAPVIAVPVALSSARPDADALHRHPRRRPRLARRFVPTGSAR